MAQTVMRAHADVAGAGIDLDDIQAAGRRGVGRVDVVPGRGVEPEGQRRYPGARTASGRRRRVRRRREGHGHRDGQASRQGRPPGTHDRPQVADEAAVAVSE